MTYLGVDTAARISAAQAKKLKENGVSFVGRYLVPAGMGKDLTASEIAGLRNAGLAILLCWEIGAGDIKGGAARGAMDGSRAKALAKGFGVPECTTIFFACDYCPVQADYPAIEAYLRAAQAACAPYVAGLYGCAKIVDYIAEQGACGKFWQCVAWSEGKISQHTNVYQYQWSGGPESKAMQAKIGVPVDMNRSEDIQKAGLWMPAYASYDDGDGGTILIPNDPQGFTNEPVGATGPAWYDEAMTYVYDIGLMKDGRPNDLVIRAELATVLMRLDKIIDRKIFEALDLLEPEDPKDPKESGLLTD